eukprot:jgi/Chlat1/572/Chrsp103S01140
MLRRAAASLLLVKGVDSASMAAAAAASTAAAAAVSVRLRPACSSSSSQHRGVKTAAVAAGRPAGSTKRAASAGSNGQSKDDEAAGDEGVVSRKQLAKLVAERVGGDLSASHASKVVGAALEEIVEAVASGKRVVLTGFGTFEPRIRRERNGRNPQTGEGITIPEQRVPGFSAGARFKDAVKSDATSRIGNGLGAAGDVIE